MILDTKDLSIKKTRELLDKKEVSVLDLVESYKKNIDKKNVDINAYLEVFGDLKEQAGLAQEKIDDRKAEVLTGVPFAIKDNILIKGRKATASSKILENYTATYTATVTRKMADQSAIFLGRTNMDEFAMGSSTENSAFGTSKNPNDTSRVPGGSSGGSAAAVASGMACAALGSDTGGSIRQPASLCGCVGFKPTYGSVSRYGLIAMGSSFDQIGPLTKTVEDAEIVFDSIKGKDPKDSTTIDEKIFTAKKTGENFVVGVPKKFLEGEGISPSVKNIFEESLKRLEDFGAEVVDIELPDPQESLSTYYVIIPAEISSNLARFDGMRYGVSIEGEDLLGDYLKTRGECLGKEVKRRIMLGTYVLSAGYYDAYYNKAQMVRSKIRNKYEEAFQNVDIIMTPTVPNPAFKIGEKTDDPLSMYLEDLFTVTANITGIPAISVPAGTIEVEGSSLPTGVQFMAGHGQEKILFEVAKKFTGEI